MNSHRFARGGVALLASFVAALVLSLTCVVPAWADPGYDSFEEARSISVNSDIRATALEDDDADWYKFTISKPGTVQLAFTHQQLTSGKWSLRITDSNAETIINYNNLPASAARYDAAKVGLPAGTYYVRVFPNYYNALEGAWYNLRVNYEATGSWETEMNNVFESADVISVGSTVNGTSMYNNDTDWYKFTLNKPASIQLTFTNQQASSGRWRVTLTNSDAEKIVENTFEASSKGGTTSTLNLAKGTYCVKVDPTYSLSDLTYTLRVAEPPQSKDMYRLYNRWTGEHFYTASATERNSLTSVGWTYEGVGWVAPTSGQAVYRLYNPFVKGGDHHYTMNVEEYNTLETLGWRKEGVGWYSGGTVKVYRQYNPFATTGTHNYTTDKNENDALVKLGWKAEGVGWYAYAGRK